MAGVQAEITDGSRRRRALAIRTNMARPEAARFLADILSRDQVDPGDTQRLQDLLLG